MNFQFFNYTNLPEILNINDFSEYNWIESSQARYSLFLTLDNNLLTYDYGVQNNILKFKSEIMNDKIKNIMIFLNAEFNRNYNSCFLNKYDNTKVGIGWHDDKTHNINHDDGIAILSIGCTRIFQYRDKMTNEIFDIPLNDNSLLIMEKDFQEKYLHRIKRDSDLQNEIRISLTFRNFNYE